MDADNVVVLEETDADGAPVLHKKERSDGAKMVGLHRNPSGQSTIAFDRRLKKRKKTEEECNREADGSTPEKKMKKVTPSITKHFQPTSLSSPSSSSSASSSSRQNKVKILISSSRGKYSDTTKLEIRLNDDDGNRFKKTARKSMRSFTALAAQGPADAPEVICLESDGDEEKEEKKKLYFEVRGTKEAPGLSAVKEEPEKAKEDASCVRKAMEALLSTCRSILPAEEFDGVERKLRKRLSSLNSLDLHSEKLAKVILTKRTAVESDHRNLFVHVQVLLDELRKCQRRAITEKKEEEEQEKWKSEDQKVKHEDQPVPGPSGLKKAAEKKKEVSSKHIRKLEAALKQCHEAIVRLNAEECDWDAEEDSAYLKADRYERKAVKLCKKLAELKGCGASMGRKTEKKFKFQGSRHPEVNAKIEKFVKRQQVDRKETMPDFADVYRLYERTSEERGLFLSKDELLMESRSTFQAVCQKLRQRRVLDTEESLASYREVPVREGSTFGTTDPADEDEVMRGRLEQNRIEKERKEQELYEDFTRKQMEVAQVPEDEQEDEEMEEEEEDREPEEDDENFSVHDEGAGDADAQDGGVETDSSSDDDDDDNGITP